MFSIKTTEQLFSKYCDLQDTLAFVLAEMSCGIVNR